MQLPGIIACRVIDGPRTPYLQHMAVLLVLIFLSAGSASAQTKPTAEIDAWIEELKGLKASLNRNYDLGEVKARIGRAYVAAGIEKAVFSEGGGIYQLWHAAEPEYRTDISRLGEWQYAVQNGMVSRDRALAVLSPRIEVFRRLDFTVNDELADQFDRIVEWAQLYMANIDCCGEEYYANLRRMEALADTSERAEWFRKVGRLNLIPKVEDAGTLNPTSVAEVDRLIEKSLACQDAPEEMASELVAWIKENSAEFPLVPFPDQEVSELLKNAKCEDDLAPDEDPALVELAERVGVSTEVCRQRVAQAYSDFFAEDASAALCRGKQLVNDDADYAQQRRDALFSIAKREKVEALTLLSLRAINSWCGPGSSNQYSIRAYAPPTAFQGRATAPKASPTAANTPKPARPADSAPSQKKPAVDPRRSQTSSTAMRKPKPSEGFPDRGPPNPGDMRVFAPPLTALVENTKPTGMQPVLAGLKNAIRNKVLDILNRARHTDLEKGIDCHGSSLLLQEAAQRGATGENSANSGALPGQQHAMFIFGKGKNFEAIDTRPGMWKEILTTNTRVRQDLERADKRLPEKLMRGAVLNEAEYNAYINATSSGNMGLGSPRK